MKKIKDRRKAFAIYVVLFVVLWNIAELLWQTFVEGIPSGPSLELDITIPLTVAIVTGYLLFIAEKIDINDELEEAKKTAGAVIVDVRGTDEYSQGHIPGAVNVPVEEIEKISSAVPDKTTPLYTYCLRGSRSRQAVKALKEMGYTQVISMGGINKYKGETER